MAVFTTRERFKRMFEHKEADRVPILGSPRRTTRERRPREGMPKDADLAEYFDLDRVVGFGGDVSPRYEQKVIEETDGYIIRLDSWGATAKNWKHASSTPHGIARAVVDRKSWAAARSRMIMTRDRVDWNRLRDHDRRWREQGLGIQGGAWFGFDDAHARVIGAERLLMWMADDPERVIDMFNTDLACSLP